MESIIQKASVLIEALPYIQQFRDAVVVVKVGGSMMEEKVSSAGILTDIAFMECVGMRPVVVHGGGKAISKRMKDRGLQATFVKGLRVTDEAAIEVVREVIGGQVNPEIVETLVANGAKARGIAGETVFGVTRRTGTDPRTGAALDWGYVGDIREVDTSAIAACIMNETIPVVTPLGRGPDGRIYNLNADDAAAAVARKLRARKLAFVSDVPGLLRIPSDESSLISTLRVRDVERLVSEGVIDGGMLPKIMGCVEAMQNGVRKVHLVDGRLPHSLLLEIFTDKGVGTEIIQDD